jgi:subtilase family serine protease
MANSLAGFFEERPHEIIMCVLRLFSILVFASALLCGIGAMAQAFAPAVRIVDRIEENHLVTLKGSTHPAAKAANDRGRVSPDLPMTDLVLVLSRSAEQQAAFDKFVASQYEIGSPDYHHWLEPEEVGERFGPAESDIATLSNWMSGHGFSIDEVSKDRMSIRFSGTAGQVERTFHTEIHNLEAKGEQHIGNMSDAQIPAALAAAVVGIKALHNFFPKPLHKLGSKVTFNRNAGIWERNASGALAGSETSAAPATVHAQFGFTTGSGSSASLVEDVVPYDFATIYNVLPLWNSGIDGTGQTIAIAGTSNINLADVANFRSIFGLPAKAPTVIIANGTDPGDCPTASDSCDADLTENTLDVEWSGAVAKGANIVLVASGSNSTTTDTLYSSESYIVEHKTAPVMNVSYGECELFNGTAENALYNSMWESAATEGIAVFVASGDASSALCDEGLSISATYASKYGLAVSGLASTPYNTAVGGTDFNWGSTAAPYWKSTNSATTGASALGYVPEVPWDNTCTNPLALTYLEDVATVARISGVDNAEAACNFVYNDWKSIAIQYGISLSDFVGIVGGSGGASGCVANNGQSVSSCTGTSTGAANGSLPLVNDGWPKPVWQTGVSGIPSDGVRDLPDVSFFAANGFLGSAYVICVSANGACVSSSALTTNPVVQEVGGTSVSSPAMAGVMALINQKAGTAQGSPNAELYTLAARQDYSSCSAQSVTASSSCYFNDINSGTNAVPCAANSPNCTVLDSEDAIGILTGHSAGTDYDLATGLGSLNVANVVNAWTLSAGSAVAMVAVTPAVSSLTENSALNVAVTVTGSSGTPTGTVTLTGGGFTSVEQPLTNGSMVFNIPANSLNAGTDTLTVFYSGDATYQSGTGTNAVAVKESTFTLSATVPAAVASGSSTSSTVTVTGGGSYIGTLSLTCALTAYPFGATIGDLPTCTGSQAVTLNPSSGTTAVTVKFQVSTTAPTSSELVRPRLGEGQGWAGGGAVLAFLVFLGIPARRRSWQSMLGVLVAMVAMGSMAGCVNTVTARSETTGPANSGTTAGNYTFKVTAIGNPSVTPAPTTTFTVIVN